MLLAQASIGVFGGSRRILRKPHIVLGLVLLPLAFVHAWLAMSGVSMKSADVAGLWLATPGLLLLQVLLGTALIDRSENSRPTRVHLTVGLCILVLASVHVLLARK